MLELGERTLCQLKQSIEQKKKSVGVFLGFFFEKANVVQMKNLQPQVA
jgi:hypothetical protein